MPEHGVAQAGLAAALGPFRLRAAGPRGPGGWWLMILSTKTARHDVVKKQRTLHRHRVPHHWILDPEHETLTLLRWADAAYLRVRGRGIHHPT